jgi:outer membrane protein assembly factor BamB
MKKWVLLFLLIYEAAACSLFEKKTLVMDPVLDFTLKKEVEVGFKGEVNQELIQSENNVYFSTSKGSLYTIDNLEGGLKLLYQSGIDFISPPYIYKESIFIYDSKNHLYCIDKNGTLIWKIHLEVEVTSGIQGATGKIFFGTENGNFLSHYMDSGEGIWKTKINGLISSLPVVVHSTIIFGCDDKNLYFLTMDGNIKDRYETGGKIRGALTYKNDLLYFGSYDEYFYCFNLNKKKIKWKVKTGGRVDTYPLIHQKYVLFTSWNNVLFCLKKKNGTILWWNQIPARCLYRLEIVGDRVLVSSLSSVLNCFDIESGDNIGHYDTEYEIKSNPLWFHNYVLLSVYDRESDSSKILFLRQKKKND